MSSSKPVRPLHIGDSGWRDVFADGFTVRRLSAVVMGLAKAFRGGKALVGFDNRFLSEELGHHVAFLLRDEGWSVDVMPEIFPTPGIASLVRNGGSAYNFGLVITASHNPYFYNGLKILDHHGALIGRETADSIEKQVNEILGSPDFQCPFHLGRRFPKTVDSDRLRRRYLDLIRSRVNTHHIREAGLSVCWDAFGGTAALPMNDFFEGLGVRHRGVPMVADPTYGGRRLEPDATSLQDLGRLVVQEGAMAGLATDIDGDRFSAIDETGAYVLNNSLGSLLVWYLLAVREETGTVYQTVSCSSMTERICREFGVPLKIEPVGFMQMGRHMVHDPTPLIGIEETGGLAYGPHLPFKDGLMAHALVLEMLATQKKTIPALIAELQKTYGRFHYRRVDLRLSSVEDCDRWLDPRLWERTVGEMVRDTSTLDGVKWTFPSGWILIRRSKTEPLLRIYFESEDPTFVESIGRMTTRQ